MVSDTTRDQADKMVLAATEIEYEIGGGKMKEEQKEHAAGDVVIISASDEVRKVPIPSNDPNDPLNFAKWRKIGIIFTCCWFSNFSLLSLSGIGTFFNTLFGLYAPSHSPPQVVDLATYPSMVMAFGCLGLLPLAIVFGRRPVFILAIVVAFCAVIGAGTSQSFESHFASRIVLGLATGATETILPLIISDITFIDERSFYFALYWACQNCVTTSLTIALSYVTYALTWRWFYWLFAITLGVGTLFVIVLCPETKFLRSPSALNGQVVYTDEFGTTHILSDEECRARFGDVQEPIPTSLTKKTYLQTLKPFETPGTNKLRIWLGVYAKILKCCTSPGVIFATMAASISLGIGIAITLIYSTLLIESFGWSPKSVGLFNAGVIPACFLAMAYSGYAADKGNLWLARRNHGVHKPEHHLIHLIFPCLVGAISIIAIAVTANEPTKHSYWGLLIGWAMYQFSFTCILITTTSFAAEVIPSEPGAALVIVIGGKNLISFGASYGLIPMLQIYTYLTAFMILLGVYLGVFALVIPVYFYGSKWKKFAR